MAKPDESSDRPVRTRLIVGAVLFGVLLVAMGLVSFSTSSSSQYPICMDAKSLTLSASETKVNVRPGCWSGWIRKPLDQDLVANAPGEVEVAFWSGERYMIADQDAQWLSGAHSSIFRLRGAKGAVVLKLARPS